MKQVGAFRCPFFETQLASIKMRQDIFFYLSEVFTHFELYLKFFFFIEKRVIFLYLILYTVIKKKFLFEIKPL